MASRCRPAWGLDRSLAICRAARMPDAPQAVFLVAQAWGCRDANQNAAVIVRYLFEEYGVRHFFAEGTFEAISAAELRARMRGKTLEEMVAGLRAGRIQPAELLAFNSDYHFDIWPADDHGLHDLNLGALMSIEETERLVSSVVAPIHAHLAAHRAAHVSAAWLDVYDRALSWYDDQRQKDASGFLNQLDVLAERLGVPIRRLPELDAWRRAHEGDTKESLALFGAEGQAILDTLVARLAHGDIAPEHDLCLLVARLAQERFHPEEVAQLEDHAIELARQRARFLPLRCLQQELHDFRNYLTGGEEQRLDRLFLDTAVASGTSLATLPRLRQRLRTAAMMTDMVHMSAFQETFNSAITALIGASPDAAYLWRMFTLERDLLFLEKLFTMTLDPNGARQAPRLRARYPMSEVLRALRSFAAPHPLLETCAAWELVWDRSLSRAMRFYRYAVQRDEFILARVRRHLQRYPGQDIAVVAGGFHCLLLQPSLVRAGIPTVAITPTVGDLNRAESESNYRAQMGRDALDLA